MTKLHKTATALLLTAALLLSGCMEQSNAPTPSSDTGTSSEISDSSSSDSSSTSEASDSTSEQENSTENSSFEEPPDINIEDFSIEFTEEDKELQTILKNLTAGTDAINSWICNAAPRDDQGLPLTEYMVIRFPEINRPNIGTVEMGYYPIPENYSEGGSLIIPNTYNGIREIVLEYLSENLSEYLKEISFIGSGSMADNSDGTFTVILDDKGADRAPKLLEIDQKIYRQEGEGGRGLGFRYLVLNSARVVSKTDDTIEFTYLADWQEYDYDSNQFIYISDESLYSKYAVTGVLKYERGGWKRDWDKDDLRRNWLTD